MEILFWKWVRKATIDWFPFANYNTIFPVKGTVPSMPCIYALHPHGLLSLTNTSHALNKESPLYPIYHNNFIGAHSLLFKFPILRECLLWVGCMPITNDYMNSMLSRGHSVIMTPGGAREIEFAKQEATEEVWSLKKHTGYLRLAKEHNVPIVPIYVEGEQDLVTWKYDTGVLDEILFTMTGFRANCFYMTQSLLPHNVFKWLMLTPATTTTHIGTPFYVTGDLETAKQDYIAHVSDLFHSVHNGNRKLVIQ